MRHGDLLGLVMKGLGILTYMAQVRILAELSTPFLNMRWFLYITGNVKHHLYIKNGFAFAIAFFISRIAIIPFFWSISIKVIHLQDYVESVNPILHVIWISLCLLLDSLNVFWFSKIVKKVLLVVKGGEIKENHAD